MFFTHVIKSFSDVPYRTSKKEDLAGKTVVTPTYDIGSKITALDWEGDQVICEDGFGTFLAPPGTVVVGKENSEFLLPDGTYLKFFEGGYVLSDEKGPFVLEEE